MASEKLYFYPVWLRIWHGINAFGILILIITGISMHWSVTSPLIGFKSAVLFHNIAGIAVAFSYVLFFTGNLFTSNGLQYKVRMKGLRKKLIKQLRYYMFGMFKKEQPPFPPSLKRKFNPLQKYSYIFVMYLLLPLLILTGSALMFPEVIVEKVFGISGIFLTAVFHSVLGFLVSLFLIIHLYVASIGKNPLGNYKSILTGWQDIDH